MSPFFSSPPFHQNLQAIFAKHCMTTRHQHHIAWLGQTNDTEALLKTEISKLVEFPQILGFWFGFDKKGGVILQTQRLLTRIIQNLQNLLIHFKTKIPIFILHPILPPPKKNEIGPHPNVVPRYLSHLSDAAIEQQPGHCESAVPGVQTSAAPREAQASLLTSWEAFTQAPIPISCEQNPATTATLLPNTGYFARKNFFEYHLVTLLEGCSHSLDSKCSQHVTYCSKTWYFFTIPDRVIHHQKNSALKPSQASPWSVKLPHAVQGI